MSNQLLTTRQLAEVLDAALCVVRAIDSSYCYNETKMANTRDTITPVITVQVELRKSRGGGREWSPLYFWCFSSRKAHSSQRIEYSYSETDPFYRAAADYLSRQGFNEDFGCVVRSHFDKKPDVKIFSFMK